MVLGSNRLYSARRRRNAIMMALSLAATAFGLGWLVLILGVLLYEGFGGLPRSLMITRIGYRAAKAGIITGVLLAIARISGETAPLLFTALNNRFGSFNLNAPIASLPVVIFQFALSPYADWQKLAWTGALVITMTVLALSIIARVLSAPRKAS